MVAWVINDDIPLSKVHCFLLYKTERQMHGCCRWFRYWILILICRKESTQVLDDGSQDNIKGIPRRLSEYWLAICIFKETRSALKGFVETVIRLVSWSMVCSVYYCSPQIASWQSSCTVNNLNILSKFEIARKTFDIVNQTVFLPEDSPLTHNAPYERYHQTYRISDFVGKANLETSL